MRIGSPKPALAARGAGREEEGMGDRAAGRPKYLVGKPVGQVIRLETVRGFKPFRHFAKIYLIFLF